MTKMMLDLFAGFGGQSEAFLQAGWDVLRIDNNPLLAEVPRMVQADVMELKPYYIGGHDRVDYVHASPPCLYFSVAFNSPRSNAKRAGENWDDSEELQGAVKMVLEAKRIIDQIQPVYWSIENVRGSIEYLTPILGPPALICGAWVYWGNFPRFDPSKLELPNKSEQDKRHSPLRANHRAHIPLNVSSAFLAAITDQKSLFEF